MCISNLFSFPQLATRSYNAFLFCIFGHFDDCITVGFSCLYSLVLFTFVKHTVICKHAEYKCIMPKLHWLFVLG